MAEIESRWGRDSPADEQAARERLLDAAETAFARFGVTRATVDDVAKVAKVHRTTVYKYFRGRDDIVVGVLLRETQEVFDRALEILGSARSFADGIVEAILYSTRAVHETNYVRLLFSNQDAAFTSRVAGTSEVFADRAAEAILPYLEAAAARGELRPGLQLRQAAAWILRVNLSFAADDENALDDDTLRAQLRTFLLPALLADPPPPHSTRRRRARR